MKTTQKDLDELQTLSIDELCQIVDTSFRPVLVAQARRILWKTNHNAPIKYKARQNNMSLLQEKQEELAPYQERATLLKNLKEDYYQLLQYIKTSKNKKGSAYLFRSVLQAQQEVKILKQKIYNLNKENSNGFYDYIGIA